MIRLCFTRLRNRAEPVVVTLGAVLHLQNEDATDDDEDFL